MKPDQTELDCLSCGACCAPPFAWKSYVEVTAEDKERMPVPFRLKVLDGELRTRRRRGGVRCVALLGELGVEVSCQIHEQRPAACRQFQRGSGACLVARRDVLGKKAEQKLRSGNSV